MENNKELIPSYLESDFATALLKSIDLLKKSDTFKDYNYKGANITMILELLSYLADFNSFHTNMLAKNAYMESANVYETVHSLSLQKGYYPKGYISSYANITCILKCTHTDDSGNTTEYISPGDQLLIKPWQTVFTGESTIDNKPIYYNTTDEYIFNISSSNIISDLTTINFYMKEGEIENLTYRSRDIIDNEIFLPFHNYDHGTYPFTVPSISVKVNNEEWERVNDFYDKISGLSEYNNDNVYMFVYDKYRRYILRFDTSRNVPRDTDEVNVTVLKSNGKNGIIGKGIINRSVNINNFEIYNITKDISIPVSQIIDFTNNESSILGSDPETIEDIKISSRANMHSQFRNVTSKDYRYHLEMRSDITKSNAWGEKEIDPGNVLEYNKVYISVIPPEGKESLFIPGTINTRTELWIEDNDPSLHQEIEVADSYNVDFRDDLLKYLEPRKMIDVYEVPVIPNIVYFRFDIGIRIKRTYNYSDVREDVRNKLIYFFNRTFRNYHEEISFMDIHNFILDQTITNNDNNFINIKGVDNLVLRELSTYTPTLSNRQFIYEPNDDNLYPMYTRESFDMYVDNKLRTIKLGYDQYPMLAIEMCRFYIEE